MLRRQFNRLVGAGAVASALPVLISPARGADPLKVGFLYLGPVGDFGWTYQHDIARKAAIEHFGDKIKTTYVENVAEGPDSEKVLNDLANQGHKLIFATSFGYMNYVLNSAKRHPAVFYEHATGYIVGLPGQCLEYRHGRAIHAGRDLRRGVGAGLPGRTVLPDLSRDDRRGRSGRHAERGAGRLVADTVQRQRDPDQSDVRLYYAVSTGVSRRWTLARPLEFVRKLSIGIAQLS